MVPTELLEKYGVTPEEFGLMKSTTTKYTLIMRAHRLNQKSEAAGHKVSSHSMSGKTTCECGIEISKAVIARHRKTKKHLKKLDELNSTKETEDKSGV